MNFLKKLSKKPTNKHDRGLFKDGYAKPCYGCKKRDKCSWDNGASHCVEYEEWLREVWAGLQKLRQTAGYDYKESEDYADDYGFYPNGERKRHFKKGSRRPFECGGPETETDDN